MSPQSHRDVFRVVFGLSLPTLHRLHLIGPKGIVRATKNSTKSESYIHLDFSDDLNRSLSELKVLQTDSLKNTVLRPIFLILYQVAVEFYVFFRNLGV